MAQTWDPQAYGQNGAFVHGLAGGVLGWLAPQPDERILDLSVCGGSGQLTAPHCSERGEGDWPADSSPQMAAAAPCTRD